MNSDDIEGDEREQSDDHFARLMKGVGKRLELPSEIRQKMERRFRQELTLANAGRKRIRLVKYAIAATVILTSLVLLNLDRQVTEAPRIVAVIAESIGEGYWQSYGAKRPLKVGNLLSQGNTIVTSSGFVRLSLFDDTLDMRVGRNSHLVFLDQMTINLVRGSVYVDAMPHEQHRFVVETPFGKVEHIGTQYTVRYDNARLTVAVREGLIKFVGDVEVIVGDPANDMAELLTITYAGIAPVSTVSKSGEYFRWVNNVAPDFSTDGRLLLEVLQWASRESGRRIEYADNEAKYLAAAAGVIRGEFRDLPIDEVIKTAADVSGLTASRLDEGIIYLSKKG